MNVGSAAYNTTIPSIGYAISSVNNGKTSIPVSPSLVIYSQFKHVSGTPAPEGTSGINITRLKILDTLIEQLSIVKNEPPMDLSLMDKNDEKLINTLIDQFQKQLIDTQTASIYAPTAPATGLLFNISV